MAQSGTPPATLADRPFFSRARGHTAEARKPGKRDDLHPQPVLVRSPLLVRPPFATYTSIAGISFPRFLLDVALTVDGLDSSLLRKDDMRHSMLTTAVRSALFSLCLLGCAVPASAATYYVRKTGNDSQAGTTPGTAFATIKKAATVAKNGDTVYVGKGQYADDVSVKNVNASVVPLRFYADTSGTMTGDGAGDVVLTAAAYLTVENSRATEFSRLQSTRQSGMEVLIDGWDCCKVARSSTTGFPP